MGQTDGRIALFQNATPVGRGLNKKALATTYHSIMPDCYQLTDRRYSGKPSFSCIAPYLLFTISLSFLTLTDYCTE